MSYNITQYVDTDFPHLIEYFVDKTNLHIPKSSKEYREVKCPCCNKIYNVKIVNLTRNNHITCDTCNDGFSYPEKFMGFILKELNIAYTYQFSPDWANGYRYDYLIFNNIIIELDGGLGHGNVDTLTKPNIDSKAIDILKDDLANQNGFKVIRIDCYYKNFNRYIYIKKSIIDSLCSYIDFSDVDFEKCNILSNGSVKKDVIECYKHNTVYIDEICEVLNIKKRTVIKYLRDAMNENIIPKTLLISNNIFKNLPPNIECISYVNNSVSGQKILYCPNDKKVFFGYVSATIYYGYNYNNFISTLHRNNMFDKKTFYVIDNINSFDFNVEPLEINKKIILQYDKSGNLVNTYNCIKSLPNNMLYRNIFRVIKGERKTAYGYVWKCQTIKEVS